MLRNLFNFTRTITVAGPAAGLPSFDVPGGPSPPPVTTTVQREGAFVTPQSLVSFAGATGAVAIIWQALGAVRPAWRTDPLVALIISVVIGLAIYLIGETDPAKAPVTIQQRLVGIFIAVINTFIIFSAAVGAVNVTT